MIGLGSRPGRLGRLGRGGWLRLAIVAAITAGFLVASSGVNRAFSYVEIGDALENRELPNLAGGSQAYLGGEDQVSVFLFVRPAQQHSLDLVREIARLQIEFAERPVHWTAIVSDSFVTSESLPALAKLAPDLPILIDVDDALYGHLGVALHPVLGIAGREHDLLAYQPFRKIHYAKVIEARLRHGLGDISAAELERLLDPPPAVQGDSTAVARRKLNLARMLFKAGKYDKALTQARDCVARDPALAAGHALLGSILRAEGDCPQALAAFERALALEPTETEALEGKSACEAER